MEDEVVGLRVTLGSVVGLNETPVLESNRFTELDWRLLWLEVRPGSDVADCGFWVVVCDPALLVVFKPPCISNHCKAFSLNKVTTLKIN